MTAHTRLTILLALCLAASLVALRFLWLRSAEAHADAVVALQRENDALGLADSRATTLRSLRADYDALVVLGAVANAGPVLRAAKAVPVAILRANGTRDQHVPGVSTISGGPADGGNLERNIPGNIPEANQGVPCSTDRVASGFEGKEEEPIAFSWHSVGPDGTPDGRFELRTPSIADPHAAVFEAHQHYRATVVTLRAASGEQTAQVALSETDAAGRQIGAPMQLSDVRYEYTDLTPKPAQWHVGAAVVGDVHGLGQPISMPGGPLGLGGIVERRVLGPVWGGAIGTSTGQFMAAVLIEL